MALMGETDVSQAVEAQAVQLPTAKRPSQLRPQRSSSRGSSSRGRKTKTDVTLETARAQLEILQQYKMLPADLDELRLMFEGGEREADRDAVLQGPASRSLRQRATPEQLRREESNAATEPETEVESGPKRVDHEDCMPLWWKDMKEKTERKKARSEARSEATGSTNTSSTKTSNRSEAASKGAFCGSLAVSFTEAPKAIHSVEEFLQQSMEKTPRAPSVGAPLSPGSSHAHRRYTSSPTSH